MRWFGKKNIKASDCSIEETESPITIGFTKPLLATELLDTPRRQKLLTHIWQRTSLSQPQFNLLYLKPIERYAELVQQFPASEAHHHAYLGGMLDHGLEIIAYALKLRQSYLLPIGATPEEQASQAEAWTACIAYAALLHDLGKIAVDLQVEDEEGEIWHPWHGAITKPYRFKYNKNREYRLHSVCSGLLAHQILDPSIMDWLSKTPNLWSSLLYVLAGQLEYAGVLGEIITKADQASVAQELGGNPEKVIAAPKHALHRKLLDGLRYLVKEQLQLNNTGPSDGWLTENALWLVSKTVADKLRAYLLSQGISGIPSKNSDIFNVLQEHSIIMPTPENKAIWSATVQSESGWQTQFTFLKLAPSIIWDTGKKEERPDSFTGTVIEELADNKADETITDHQPPTTTTNTSSLTLSPTESLNQVDNVTSLDTVLNLLGMTDNALTATEIDTPQEAIDHMLEPKITNQANDIIELTPQAISILQPSLATDNLPSGEHFLQWFKDSLLTKKLIINDAKALVHTVANTIYMVSPGIFVRYAQEFPQVQQLAREQDIPEWRWAQKEFEHLKLHKKQPNGLNIWTCIVKGPHKTRQVHGYLFEKPELILTEIAFNNPYLSIIGPEQNK